MHAEKTAVSLLVVTLCVLGADTPLRGQETPRITTREVGDYVGQEVTVCGAVFDVSAPSADVAQPTLVKLGGPYPNRIVTVVIANEDRHEFPRPPEIAYDTDEICVTGTIRIFDRGPSIPITGPEAIRPWNRDSGEAVDPG